MANCWYLHDSCFTKFDFVNYAFAKLVVAWLYSAWEFKFIQKKGSVRNRKRIVSLL